MCLRHLRPVNLPPPMSLVWPSKKQVINNTLVVIAVVIICGLVIFGLDNLFGLILRLILRQGA